jgi:hypothetical protein
MPSYQKKAAEHRFWVGGVGIATNILFAALTGLGLPQPAWALAAGIGTALLAYALLVEGPASGSAGPPRSAQYNDGGSGDGDRYIISAHEVHIGAPGQRVPPANSEPH